ncbi:hypothetical protein [Candidatus Villigracilis saccharophilus]|uniref:hypothetical protein n=1 Tax=Candidatus Villigracilis saccharophilus TaxID=3140684 RepID=UPI003134F082|nr:hypothetical protein [Anaerolineales bacterium]
MDQKPSVSSILHNDNWTAPATGVFAALLIMTSIVALTLQFTTISEVPSATPFIIMTSISGFAAVLITLWRIRYINEVFENGYKVTAQVLSMSAHRSNMRLKLRYTYLSQIHEQKLDQVITERTKKLLQQKEVTLVIDQNNPKHILLWDVYFS